jgi:hypothetical protein
VLRPLYSSIIHVRNSLILISGLADRPKLANLEMEDVLSLSIRAAFRCPFPSEGVGRGLNGGLGLISLAWPFSCFPEDEAVVVASIVMAVEFLVTRSRSKARTQRV